MMTASKRDKAATPADDFVVFGSGSVYLVHPRTDAASDHLRRVVGEDAQFLGNAVAVEHRYVGDFVAALAEDGYTVAAEV